MMFLGDGDRNNFDQCASYKQDCQFHLILIDIQAMSIFDMSDVTPASASLLMFFDKLDEDAVNEQYTQMTITFHTESEENGLRKTASDSVINGACLYAKKMRNAARRSRGVAELQKICAVIPACTVNYTFERPTGRPMDATPETITLKKEFESTDVTVVLALPYRVGSCVQIWMERLGLKVREITYQNP
jgi:hypothetical protein